MSKRPEFLGLFRIFSCHSDTRGLRIYDTSFGSRDIAIRIFCDVEEERRAMVEEKVGFL